MGIRRSVAAIAFAAASTAPAAADRIPIPGGIHRPLYTAAAIRAAAENCGG